MNISPTQRLITKARLRAKSWMPYLQHVWKMMRLVETDKVPTMAVDEAARLYVNPAFVSSLSIDEIAYVLLHETLHVVLSHCHRLRELFPDCGEHERYVWNISTDLVIQQMLKRHHQSAEGEGYIKIDGCVPGIDPPLPFLQVPGLTRDQSSEKYMSLLLSIVPKQGQKSGGGKPGDDGKKMLDPADAGSNSDGQPKPWEIPSTGNQRALVKQQLRKVEEEIKEIESSSPGTVDGNITKAIEARLHKQPDPFLELRRVVGTQTSGRGGTKLFTYARPSRRQQPGGTIKAGYRTLVPSCSIIIDTSGSMQGLETKALTAIAQGLKRVERPRVVAYDTRCQDAKNITSLKQFKFVGYGGTNMTKAIEEEDERRPDAIVLVTDGETNWPTTPTRSRLIVALVKRSHYSAPPSWAKVIDCTREAVTYHG